MVSLLNFVLLAPTSATESTLATATTVQSTLQSQAKSTNGFATTTLTQDDTIIIPSPDNYGNLFLSFALLFSGVVKQLMVFGGYEIFRHTFFLICCFNSRVVTAIDVSEQPSEPILLSHEILGSAGPDKRESDGMQRALDWLKDKRSADYGWENDTHMVILAKEVRPVN